MGEVGKRCCVVIQCFETSHAPVFPSAGPLVRFGLLTRICATSGYPGEVSGHKGPKIMKDFLESALKIAEQCLQPKLAGAR